MPEVMENPELRQEYEQRKERTAALTDLTLQSTDGSMVPPTPTQEENDLLALGLMHPDDKAQAAQDKMMPSVAAQQAYLATGAEMPKAPAAAPRPATPPRTEPAPPHAEPNRGRHPEPNRSRE
jgi:hypothetical protein